MKTQTFDFTFVEEIPETLEDGMLYVSIEYATASHLCACGCGIRVVTPLTATDWSVIYNGDAVGLSPSIGNWSFPCRSHYWIRLGKVIWSEAWPDWKVDANRKADLRRKGVAAEVDPVAEPSRRSWFDRVKSLFS